MDDESKRGVSAFFIFAAACALASAAGGIFDIVVGSALGGLGGIPPDAAGRFAQFEMNPWLGLYYLDLLNCATTLLLLPALLAVCVIHREKFPALSALAACAAAVGTALFLGGNSALSMLSLSRSYQAADEARKVLLAAAGEAMIARGEHGGPAVFPAFMLCSCASFLAAVLQLRGKAFPRSCALCGIAGNTLLMVYLVLVTFVPGLKSVAVGIAAPGGILSLAWIVMTSVSLVRMSKREGAVL